ncbi:MAG: hypothetical protein RMY36_033370 [Nostoc sp. SerVER01]|nr:hypothetical protein [Nostoc sp. SerVER01]MDZ8027016.1 hypothetical protein [Nostoc sp. DedQUE11]
MNKSQSIKLLESEGWTKADAMRALEIIDFSTNPDEITIRRAVSAFAGSELIKRQRLQAAQKGLVTKKSKEIEKNNQEYAAKIEHWLSIEFKNLWVICQVCNQEKSEMHWYEYEHYIFVRYPDLYLSVKAARPSSLLQSLKD